jgi:hypothetical protein
MVDYDKDADKLVFSKQPGKMIVSDIPDDMPDDAPMTKSDAVGLPMPQASAAPQTAKSKGEQNDN